MTPADVAVPASVRRVREVAVAVCLVAAAFAQAPGLVVADTKLDLVLDPGSFLRRALLAWDPHTGFGQLQNQAYGYLFPMGPFFLLGHLAHVPAWVVQRAWWALLLVVAWGGMLRLLAALGVGTWTTRMVASVAFALSPRVLTTLGALSVESWPLALVPWVLLPLVRCRHAGQARRAGLLSGVALACVGAVNAAATLAVLLPPALWLATRRAGRARRRLAAWWCLGVALACAWWVLPLVVLAGFAFPFLDYIESARVTTSVTALLEVLRGTSDWVAFSPSLGEPSWPAGWWLATATVAVVATGTVVALGVLGLARRDLPERRFLVLSLVLGTVLMAVGHRGPLAPAVRDLLDGPLAPLRNVHKLDLLVRVPVTAGLAHLLAVGPGVVRRAWGRASRDAPAEWGVPGTRPVVAAVATLVVLALVGAVAPAVRGDLAARSPFEDVPPYWVRAAAWLDAHQGGRTLLAPASAFGDYRWGHTNDEPLVALTRSSLALRDAVPLGAPGATRLLDGVVEELAAGRPSAALGPALAAAGIGRVLLRGDVDPRAVADPVAAVRASLLGSPGLRRAVGFGPRVAGSDGLVGGLSLAPPPRQVLEVWVVDGPHDVDGVRALPLREARRLAGGPESALGRAEAGLATGATVPATIGADGRRVPGLHTDTLRRRRLDFGAAPGSAYGPTVRAAEQLGGDRAASDLMPAPPVRQTVARYAGGAAVSASSTAADPTRPGWRGAGTRPASALDADGRTSWVTSDVPGPRWLEVRWPRPHRLGRLTVVARERTGLAVPSGVRVVTDGGERRATRRPDGTLTVVPPAAPTRRVRLVFTSPTGAVVAVDDVLGLTVPESLAVPRDRSADASTDVWVLRRSPGRGGCLDVGPAWTCSPDLVRAGEDGPTWRRTLRVDRGAPVAARATVRPVPGPELSRALDRALGYRARASSTVVDHPAARPGAAFDGDPETAWVASSRDSTPTLTVTLTQPAVLTRVALGTDRAGESGLQAVVVSAGGEQRRLPVGGRSRRTAIEPLAGRTFRFAFVRAADQRPEPIRVVDIGLSELDRTPDVARTLVEVPCPVGPQLRVGKQALAFTATASVAQLVSGAALPALPCGPGPTLTPGAPVLEARASPLLSLEQVTLGATVPPAAGRRVRMTVDEAEHRSLAVGPGASSLLVLDQGANDGWRATADGRRLRQVTVDGWRQGWVLPAGGPVDVRLDFAPGRWHRAGLLVGLLALLLLGGLVGSARRVVPQGEPLVAATSRSWLWYVVPPAVGTVLAGPAGLALGALTVVTGRRWPGLVGPAAGLCLVLASVWSVTSAAFAGGLAGWLLALLGVLLLASLPDAAPLRGHRAAEPIEQRALQQHP